MFIGFVADQLRRTNRNLRDLGILISLASLGVAWLGCNVLLNAALGPRLATLEEIAAITQPELIDRYWVRLELGPGQLAPEFVQATDQHGEVTQRFYFLHSSRGIVVVVVGATEELPEVIDAKVMPRWHGAGVRDAADLMASRIKGPLLPAMLKTVNVRAEAGMLLGVILGIVAFGGLLMYRARQRRLEPFRHPLVRALERWGPPEEIALALDAEMQAGPQYFGRVVLTQSWLVRKFFFSVTLIYLGDVVWAYRKHCRTYERGRTIVDTYLVVCDRYGRRIQLALKPEPLNQLTAQVKQHVPWAVFGFAPNLEQMWRKNKAAFLTAVDERRRAYLAQASFVPDPASGDPRRPGLEGGTV